MILNLRVKDDNLHSYNRCKSIAGYAAKFQFQV